MAKDFEMGYLLDFYGEVLTPKQREMLRQYYNDDLSLSEIGENFGITRQGARDAIKHGETALKELEEKVGFAARYRRVQQTLEALEQAGGSYTILRDYGDVFWDIRMNINDVTNNFANPFTLPEAPQRGAGRK